MSKIKIVEVQITAGTKNSEGYYKFDVYTDNSVTELVSIIISDSNNTKNIRSLTKLDDGNWGNNYGYCSVLKSDVEECEQLYVFLIKKDSTSVLSENVVRLFTHTPTITGCTLENGLTLKMDRTNDNFDIAQRLDVVFPPPIKIVSAVPPKCSFDLPSLNIWGDEPEVDITLRYYMEDTNARVYSASSDKIPVLLAAPEIEKLEWETDKLKFTLKGNIPKSTEQIIAYVWLRGEQVHSEKLDKSSRNIQLSLDSNEDYEISFCFKNKYGVSKMSKRLPIITQAPVVLSIRFTSPTTAVLQMSSGGQYDIDNGKETKFAKDGVIEISNAPKEINLRKIVGNSYSSVTKVGLEVPGYYSFEEAQKMFWSLSGRPISSFPSTDITKEVSAELDEYTSKYFVFSSGKLTIKWSNVKSDSISDVHKSFAEMLEKAKNYDSLKALISAVVESMPLRKDDFLFYHYGADNGYIDLHPGMSLLVEYSVYQNIPEEDKKTSDKCSGYIGTTTVRYPIVKRGENITFEPYASSQIDAKAFIIPKPKPPIGSKTELSGAAGVLDLLYAGFQAPFVRLVYPLEYLSREGEGSVLCSDNITLLASSNRSSLNEATEKLRTKSSPSYANSVAYNYFRGRASVIPQVQIFVCGLPQWVSLATTLGDIAAQLSCNLSQLQLLRSFDSGFRSVVDVNSQMPLLAGDRIEVK
ncbi:MAG: hypothetical protein LBU89_04305 [Fibromonadaceae bacterium]|jgi:hypothetical protein|nr:hypothetical protein [Fibromonadaceae bacterium]